VLDEARFRACGAHDGGDSVAPADILGRDRAPEILRRGAVVSVSRPWLPPSFAARGKANMMAARVLPGRPNRQHAAAVDRAIAHRRAFLVDVLKTTHPLRHR
jgi:hypothetical protein